MRETSVRGLGIERAAGPLPPPAEVMVLTTLPVYLVHWNAVEWCASAAGSILASQGLPVEITVIDNGATGADALRRALPPEVRVLTVPTNDGYAGGANAALDHWARHYPHSAWAVIASHDLHVEPDALARLVEVAASDPTIGIVGPAVTGPTKSFGGRWDGTRGRLVKAPSNESLVDRDWVSGTCLLLRRACCDSTGRFDTNLGSYAEDVDYGLRARDDDWRVVIAEDARVSGVGTRSPGAVRSSTRNNILLSAKRNGLRGYGVALLRVMTEVVRGYGAGLNPRRSQDRRVTARALARQRQAGIWSALDLGAVRRALHPSPRSNPTVVFISHEAHRSGAPRLLLALVRWLTEHTDVRGKVVVGAEGPMVPEFAQCCRVYRMPPRTPVLGRIVHRLRLAPHVDVIRLVRARYRRYQIGTADAFYANTMLNADTLRLLGRASPVVCHVHELGGAIRRRTAPADITAMTRRVDSYVAVSEAVRNDLINDLGISPDRVQVVHGFLEPEVLALPHDAAARARARQALGLDDSAFVVGGAGRADWAKGADRFVKVAAALHHDESAQFQCVWVGPVKDADLRRFREDLRRLGAENAITFTGERVDAPKCFAAFDVLALTSREDSYPLVMLECAALEIPTVCFADGGGAPEFVGDDCGVVVTESGPRSFADAVAHLARHRDERDRLGQQARDSVASKHTVGDLAPQILDTILRVGDHKRRGARE